MRRLNLIFLLVCSLMVSCTAVPEGKYVINGKTDVADNDEYLLLTVKENGRWDTLQRTVPQNGQFRFEGDMPTPQICYLACNNRQVNSRIPMLLEDTIFSVEIYKKDFSDFRNFKVEGGELQRTRNRLYDIQREDYADFDSIVGLIDQANEEGDIAAKMHHRVALELMGVAFDNHENEFIATEKDNLAALSVVYNKLRFLQYEPLKKKVELLSDTMLNTKEGKLIQERLLILQKLEPGALAPYFQLATLAGDTISLNDLNGKVKVLDFWASWCGPCRAANPHMKEIYNKYKDKGLVMLGISMDTSKEAWKSAVEADGLPWLQASNLDGISGEVAKKYRISGIPRVFVLDENNRILGETLRYDEIVELIEKAL